MKNIIIEVKTLMDGVTRKLDTVRNNGDGCNGIIMDKFEKFKNMNKKEKEWTKWKISVRYKEGI